MKNGVIKFFLVIIIIIGIIYIGKILIDNNVFKVKNFDLFEADNENYFRIEIEPVADGSIIEYYNVDLLNKKIVHIINRGMISNEIEVLNEKTLTEQEVIRVKELFNNASDTYIDQSGVNKYYKISNGKYIWDFEDVEELEQILRK